MPPSPGYRRPRITTAIASGTKKVANATSHSAIDIRPYTATAGTLLMLTMATILRRTRSERPSVRGIARSRGGPAITSRAGEPFFEAYFVAHRNSREPGHFLAGVHGDAVGHEIGQPIATPLIEVERRQVVVGRRDDRAAQVE